MGERHPRSHRSLHSAAPGGVGSSGSSNKQEETALDERAMDLLEAAYRSSGWQQRGGRRLLLTRLDGDVADAAGLFPTERDTPEGRMHHAVVDSLVDSGAVAMPDIRDQKIGEFYEITAIGVEMLREAGRITT